MLTRFLDTVAGRLATEWIAISTQGLVFWAGGLVAVSASTGQSPLTWSQEQQPNTRIFVAVAAALAVVLSGAAVRRLTPTVLGLLEGYGWPSWPRRAMTARQQRRRQRLRARWEALRAELDDDGGHDAAPNKYDDLVRTDTALRRIPAAPRRQLPTWVGNTLRAAESRPYEKYGLDAVKCWPHLWLLLPAETRGQLAATRAALDSAVSALIWAAAFVIWTPWSWWAAPVAVVAVAVLHRGPLRTSCAAFADVLEAAFDLHRFALYTALRWPVPGNPAQEREQGKQLTTYLWRGSDATAPAFTVPPTPIEERQQ
jgi:hypothetical protein